MRKIILILLTVIIYSSCNNEVNKSTEKISNEEITVLLDSINIKEQSPIRKRDSLIKIYGAESKEAEYYQKIYRKNHIENEIVVLNLIDSYGWPSYKDIGKQGSRTICNVLQHSSVEVRQKYLSIMERAVIDGKLEARYLVRAEDRLATDRNELQIYGGQMKYYPESKTFNVWPVFDPVNIDKRRAKIGLGPISEYLKDRFDFEWKLEEQIKRTKAFEENKVNMP